MGSSPGAANYFFIWMFNLGIAYGAQVGLKLRLVLYNSIVKSANFNSIFKLNSHNYKGISNGWKYTVDIGQCYSCIIIEKENYNEPTSSI